MNTVKKIEYNGKFFYNFYIRFDEITNKGKKRFIYDSSEFLDELFIKLVELDNISVFKFPYLLFELFENNKIYIRGDEKEYELNLFRKHKTFATKLENGTDYKRMYLEVLDYYGQKFHLEDVLN